MRDPRTPPEDFVFPDDAVALVAAKALASLNASPYWASLCPYFATLETRFQRVQDTAERSFTRQPRLPLTSWLRLFSYHRSVTTPKISSDVLVVGECQRAADIAMMVRLLAGLIRMGLRVVYLSRFGTPEHRAITLLSSRLARPGHISILDPFCYEGRFSRTIAKLRAAGLARTDYERISATLRSNFALRPGSFLLMRQVASAKLAWEALAPSVSYGMVFARNHFHTLSAAVAVYSLERRIPVVTFQHGVVSTGAPFIPVVATQQVCFGPRSSLLLSRLDEEAHHASSRPRLCKHFLNGGALFDTILTPRNNRAERTVLFIDQQTNWAGEFYGINLEFACLIAIAKNLITGYPSISRVIVRLHPDNRQPDSWHRLQDDCPRKFSISPAGTPLAYDLARTSVVVGLFSGALVTAAASGIPVLFVWQPGWFFTPDLSDFFPSMFIAPDEVPGRIAQILSAEDHYAEASASAIDAARGYYSPLETQQFRADFLASLLSGCASAHAT